MVTKLAPFPVGISPGSSYWTDLYERIRFLVNQQLESINWNIITGKPTTLAGYGITDAAPLSHVGAGGTAHANATTSTAGFMSSTDKTKIDEIISGTYTPTLTNVLNVSSSTAYLCQYMRVGSVVTVSGKYDITPTAAASTTRLGISLPIASNFAAGQDLGGVAASVAIASEVGGIIADTTNDRAQVNFITTTTTANSMYFTFTYRII